MLPRVSKPLFNLRRHISVVFGLAAMAAIAAAPSAAASDRAALVIGNSAYRNTPRLDNPINDARDIAAALKGLGFDVIEANDLDKAGMDQAIRKFADTLSSAKVGLFYYAGHGLQVAGQNYLVPIDAELSTASALDFEMVRLDLVHRTMESAVATNIIVLDACRDNPLSRNLARALGTRSAAIGRGLAAVESGEGTLISFSTQPGSVALDGEGANSPFAAALVKHIGEPGDDLSSVLINVRNDVMEATAKRQVPWEHSALTARFYFLPPAAAAEVSRQTETPAAVPTYEQQAEMAFWGAVKDSGSPLIIQTYLDRFPRGTFVGLAKALIEGLEKDAADREAAKRDAEAAKAEAARKAAEELSEAALKADVGKQSEVLLKSKEEAIKEAEQKLAAAERAAEEARQAADRAKEEKAHIELMQRNASGPAMVAGLTEPLDTAEALQPVRPMPAIDTSDSAALTRALQSELDRVGCDPGAIDGNWGEKGRNALREFAEEAKLALPVDEPTVAALQAVSAQKDRVCALSCAAGEVMRNGECVRGTRSKSVSRDDEEPARTRTKKSASHSDGDSGARSSSKSTSSKSYGSKSSGSKSYSSKSSGSKSYSGKSYSSRSSQKNRAKITSDGAIVGALIVGAAIGLKLGKGKKSSSGQSQSSDGGAR